MSSKRLLTNRYTNVGNIRYIPDTNLAPLKYTKGLIGNQIRFIPGRQNNSLSNSNNKMPLIHKKIALRTHGFFSASQRHFIVYLLREIWALSTNIG